jgi:hypothetical protein
MYCKPLLLLIIASCDRKSALDLQLVVRYVLLQVFLPPQQRNFRGLQEKYCQRCPCTIYASAGKVSYGFGSNDQMDLKQYFPG